MATATTKPGSSTTEFKGKIVVQVVSAIAAIAPRALGYEISADAQMALIELALCLIAGVEAAYAVSRGVAKRK